MAKYFKKEGDKYVEVEDSLFTQTEIDSDIIPKRLDRERKKFADYEDLKVKAGEVDTIKEDYEKKLGEATNKVTDLEGQVKKANLETKKVGIVNEFGLSKKLASFLTAEDEEALRKQAEDLSEGGGGSGGVSIDKNGKPDDKPTEAKKLAKSLLGGSSDD